MESRINRNRKAVARMVDDELENAEYAESIARRRLEHSRGYPEHYQQSDIARLLIEYNRARVHTQALKARHNQ